MIHYHNMSLIGIAALSYGAAVKLYTGMSTAGLPDAHPLEI